MSTDVLGYLVQIVSGMPFETFLKTRIFEPLGMNDTGFSVRVENADRYSKVYEFGEDGALQAIEKIHAATGPLSFFPLWWWRATIDRRRLPPLLPDGAQRW